MLVGRPHDRRRRTTGSGKLPSSRYLSTVARDTPTIAHTWYIVSSLSVFDIAASSPLRSTAGNAGNECSYTPKVVIDYGDIKQGS